jgi:methionyl-tRNA synthetase
MPKTSRNMLSQINAGDQLKTIESITSSFGYADSYDVGTPEPLFARIDSDKLLAKIEAEATAAEPECPQSEEEPENIVFMPTIDFETFEKIDLRIAKVVDCEPIKKSKKLLKLTLDDGSGTLRTVCSGIAKWYTPLQLKGQNVILVANLKPVKLCGVESQGMILAADEGEDVRVLFVDGTSGSRVR